MKIKSEYLLLIFASVIFLDRMFKNYLQDSCFSVFCIKRATNTGAAFGIFPGQLWLFILVSAIVFVMVILFWKTEKIRLALALIAAGTLGNLVDRLNYGRIIDVFSVAGSSSFNLADLANLAGAVLLVIFILGKSRKSK